MTIRIETNKRGVEEIVGENSRGQKHVVEATRIFVRADGHVFLAPLSERPNLVPLNPHEVGMIQYWLREKDAGDRPVPENLTEDEVTRYLAMIEPNVFAGESPPDG